MKVCVVLLNWNGWHDTLECLESLFKSSYSEFSVIVCDNSSTDGSLAEITKWANARFNPQTFISFTEKEVAGNARMEPEIRIALVSNSANHGFAGGNNVGIQLALKNQTCEYIWLLNNDTVLDPNALELLVAKAATDEKIGICGSLLCFYHDRTMVQAVGGVTFNLWLARGKQIGQGLSIQSKEIVALANKVPSYIAGASMLLRKRFILDIGCMETKYFLYFEELDWATRCKSKWKLATASDSIVFHKEGGAIGTSSLVKRSNLSQYYLNRNLILFYFKFHPSLIPIAILRVLREALSSIKSRDYIQLKTTCRALVDGLLQRDGIKQNL